MPPLNTRKIPLVKMLVVGDSGAGKTGGLASLADAGYKLRILDFDRGLDPLRAFTKKLENIDAVTLTDRMKASGANVLTSGQPKAFANALALLTNWRYSYNTETGEVVAYGKAAEKDKNIEVVDYGPPGEWGSESILVVDSMSFWGMAALRYVLFLNNRLGKHPYQSDWGDAQQRLEDALSLMWDDHFQTNVIITSHITTIGEEGEIKRAMPMALGKALPPRIPRYFNTFVRVKNKGSGEKAQKVVRTVSEGNLELKTPVKSIPAELPLATGYLDLFKLIRGEK